MEASTYRLQKVDFLLEQIDYLTVPTKQALAKPRLQNISPGIPTKQEKQPEKATNDQGKSIQPQKDKFDEHLEILKRASKASKPKNSPERKNKKYLDTSETESEEIDIPKTILNVGYNFAPKNIINKRIPVSGGISMNNTKPKAEKSTLPYEKEKDLFQKVHDAMNNNESCDFGAKPKSPPRQSTIRKGENPEGTKKLAEKLKQERQQRNEEKKRKSLRRIPQYEDDQQSNNTTNSFDSEDSEEELQIIPSKPKSSSPKKAPTIPRIQPNLASRYEISTKTNRNQSKEGQNSKENGYYDIHKKQKEINGIAGKKITHIQPKNQPNIPKELPLAPKFEKSDESFNEEEEDSEEMQVIPSKPRISRIPIRNSPPKSKQIEQKYNNKNISNESDSISEDLLKSPKFQAKSHSFIEEESDIELPTKNTKKELSDNDGYNDDIEEEDSEIETPSTNDKSKLNKFNSSGNKVPVNNPSKYNQYNDEEESEIEEPLSNIKSKLQSSENKVQINKNSQYNDDNLEEESDIEEPLVKSKFNSGKQIPVKESKQSNSSRYNEIPQRPNNIKETRFPEDEYSYSDDSIDEEVEKIINKPKVTIQEPNDNNLSDSYDESYNESIDEPEEKTLNESNLQSTIQSEKSITDKNGLSLTSTYDPNRTQTTEMSRKSLQSFIETELKAMKEMEAEQNQNQKQQQRPEQSRSSTQKSSSYFYTYSEEEEYDDESEKPKMEVDTGFVPVNNEKKSFKPPVVPIFNKLMNSMNNKQEQPENNMSSSKLVEEKILDDDNLSNKSKNTSIKPKAVDSQGETNKLSKNSTDKSNSSATNRQNINKEFNDTDKSLNNKSKNSTASKQTINNDLNYTDNLSYKSKESTASKQSINKEFNDTDKSLTNKSNNSTLSKQNINKEFNDTDKLLTNKSNKSTLSKQSINNETGNSFGVDSNISTFKSEMNDTDKSLTNKSKKSSTGKQSNNDLSLRNSSKLSAIKSDEKDNKLNASGTDKLSNKSKLNDSKVSTEKSNTNNDALVNSSNISSPKSHDSKQILNEELVETEKSRTSRNNSTLNSQRSSTINNNSKSDDSGINLSFTDKSNADNESDALLSEPIEDENSSLRITDKQKTNGSKQNIITEENATLKSSDKTKMISATINKTDKDNSELSLSLSDKFKVDNSTLTGKSKNDTIKSKKSLENTKNSALKLADELMNVTDKSNKGPTKSKISMENTENSALKLADELMNVTDKSKKSLENTENSALKLVDELMNVTDKSKKSLENTENSALKLVDELMNVTDKSNRDPTKTKNSMENTNNSTLKFADELMNNTYKSLENTENSALKLVDELMNVTDKSSTGKSLKSTKNGSTFEITDKSKSTKPNTPLDSTNKSINNSQNELDKNNLSLSISDKSESTLEKSNKSKKSLKAKDNSLSSLLPKSDDLAQTTPYKSVELVGKSDDESKENGLSDYSFGESLSATNSLMPNDEGTMLQSLTLTDEKQSTNAQNLTDKSNQNSNNNSLTGKSIKNSDVLFSTLNETSSSTLTSPKQSTIHDSTIHKDEFLPSSTKSSSSNKSKPNELSLAKDLNSNSIAKGELSKIGSISDKTLTQDENLESTSLVIQKIPVWDSEEDEESIDESVIKPLVQESVSNDEKSKSSSSQNKTGTIATPKANQYKESLFDSSSTTDSTTLECSLSKPVNLSKLDERTNSLRQSVVSHHSNKIEDNILSSSTKTDTIDLKTKAINNKPIENVLSSSSSAKTDFIDIKTKAINNKPIENVLSSSTKTGSIDIKTKAINSKPIENDSDIEEENLNLSTIDELETKTFDNKPHKKGNVYDFEKTRSSSSKDSDNAEYVTHPLKKILQENAILDEEEEASDDEDSLSKPVNLSLAKSFSESLNEQKNSMKPLDQESVSNDEKSNVQTPLVSPKYKESLFESSTVTDGTLESSMSKPVNLSKNESKVGLPSETAELSFSLGGGNSQISANEEDFDDMTFSLLNNGKTRPKQTKNATVKGIDDDSDIWSTNGGLKTHNIFDSTRQSTNNKTDKSQKTNEKSLTKTDNYQDNYGKSLTKTNDSQRIDDKSLTKTGKSQKIDDESLLLSTDKTLTKSAEIKDDSLLSIDKSASDKILSVSGNSNILSEKSYEDSKMINSQPGILSDDSLRKSISQKSSSSKAQSNVLNNQKLEENSIDDDSYILSEKLTDDSMNLSSNDEFRTKNVAKDDDEDSLMNVSTIDDLKTKKVSKNNDKEEDSLMNVSTIDELKTKKISKDDKDKSYAQSDLRKSTTMISTIGDELKTKEISKKSTQSVSKSTSNDTQDLTFGPLSTTTNSTMTSTFNLNTSNSPQSKASKQSPKQNTLTEEIIEDDTDTKSIPPLQEKEILSDDETINQSGLQKLEEEHISSQPVHEKLPEENSTRKSSTNKMRVSFSPDVLLPFVRKSNASSQLVNQYESDESLNNDNFDITPMEHLEKYAKEHSELSRISGSSLSQSTTMAQLSYEEDQVLRSVLPRAVNMNTQEIYAAVSKEMSLPRNNPSVANIVANICKYLGIETEKSNPLQVTQSLPDISEMAEESSDDYF
ncbi:hypothetical protein TVAG_163040 [Trichomonas vaginalis G3]|uniref:Uncharacterized protein n=1 Tax=Trichomonas vaginalis (strain ATCC PRA-98 / G3) TaxID=412133 RepID=A2DFY1_TRIV3|nr:hypothetical protein TVAGG3_0950830 [Trichomonas vaginalis G3]EAY20608.1 hypothetical protein TVAG_163040 [Trichomonas vaginalis G3]KAI5487204.1 hypothetical protein TVAGG3_0950830 [Trichomonas vaginalis G3]|eukprot:XP_001581594.1 hypothetical protein [Trichomonas vaginalis G3]